jgi:hypothetical protein
VSQADWQQRYDRVMRDRFTAEETALVLDLLYEDQARLEAALWEVVRQSDIVVCECADAECLAGHASKHAAPACWRVTHIEDTEDDYVHLCTPCVASRDLKPDASRFRFEEIEEYRKEEVPGD